MATVEQAVKATGDQFYVTHCAIGDSVLNNPGYTVRAASVTDSAALDAAFHYPPYELPIDLWKPAPVKAQAPRRLARTAHPNGGVWVAHSVYLEKDTVGRERSYFSHLLHLPATVADPIAVLESWDADGWAKGSPTGGPKTLPRVGLPTNRAISQGMLLAFLSRPKSGATDLASVACPTRFHSDVSARCDLVSRFCQALVLVTAAKVAESPRDRLFVHAEPGLVAMLLYAAARILPPHFTADLTFSTFEPAHRALRAYNLATVVGTYLGAPDRGLDPDLATKCGYVLDAFKPERSSPELSGWVEAPNGISELIDLAVEGNWELLGKVHRRIGTGADALARVAKTIDGLRAAPDVKASRAKPPASAARQLVESVTPSETEVVAAPARLPERVRWWADTRTRVGAVACGLLLVAVVVLALRNPNRATNKTTVESVAVAPVAAPPPANPVVQPLMAKPVAPVLPNPADPLPPMGELTPVENPAVLAETVGLLAGLQLYQSYLNIGLLADAGAEGLYEAGELTQLLGSVVTPLEKIEKQLEKVAGLKSLSEDDAAAVARMQKIAGLLRQQGKSLRSFWETGVADHGKKYEESRQTAWAELSDLLQLAPKKDTAPEPKPVEKP